MYSHFCRQNWKQEKWDSIDTLPPHSYIGDSLNAISDVFLPRNLEESGKEVIFANRKEKGKINMEVNMTEQNKQYRLTSLEEPTDEMLFELMAGVENIAKNSSAKAEAEKKRRLQAVAEEILAWRANQ